MKTMTIYPVVGRTLLMPERGWAPVPAEGVEVHEEPYYVLAVRVGDVTLIHAAVVPVAHAAAPTVVPAHSAPQPSKAMQQLSA